ncbi:hypothetical protein FCT18_14745 [Lysinibacillus sphaericus]|uniref:Uncharacterized protein n=1 Tax=Lysinibacillus sphaericus TaxID=1421 RepID=A0A2S0K686_LYSSH|nr:hypothetical protein [Lysinibacillus sphaericus]AVK98846.1 hypothetical protein LS41612_22420 [Lysinibacillus sphaericus]MED4545292.1 hypothetical protein [Lysinibacillus sphaericus]TKI18352.1 hypothetical protein FCT18_14745 [Lysinibacillus sphaericus]SUV15138.1 Uncharacterised protein [Lysinibacillus sphaericus]GEC82201.1 hypothetical protein LSP03_19440 [Lysinibacillus sphaericus]
MARIRINMRDDNRIPEIKRDLQRARNKKAKVGYIKDSELAMIASVHEYGARIEVTDKMRGYLSSQGLHLKADTTHIIIPERSFMRTGADLHERDVQRKAEQLIDKVIAGNVSVETFFEQLANELKGKIQEHAIDLDNPVNHPFTVEQKGSSNPLVKSGGLIGKMEVDIE